MELALEAGRGGRRQLRQVRGDQVGVVGRIVVRCTAGNVGSPNEQEPEMGMSLDQFEAAALALPEESRAQLVGALLLSLEKANRGGDEVAHIWQEEAERRDEAMERSGNPGIPAEEVFRRLGPRLK